VRVELDGGTAVVGLGCHGNGAAAGWLLCCAASACLASEAEREGMGVGGSKRGKRGAAGATVATRWTLPACGRHATMAA
jgi:hypothetical protein